tara:strand:+ start:367 stop:546 length:180 start_codon:yes stop_codon:yes gene_type:complete
MVRLTKTLDVLNNPIAQDDPEKQKVNLLNLKKSEEVGGRDGPEPTRYGDWEKNGRCIDF